MGSYLIDLLSNLSKLIRVLLFVLKLNAENIHNNTSDTVGDSCARIWRDGEMKRWGQKVRRAQQKEEMKERRRDR